MPFAGVTILSTTSSETNFSFPFYSNMKQTASRTDKEMVALRLFDGSYFPVDRHYHILRALCQYDIIPSKVSL